MIKLYTLFLLLLATNVFSIEINLEIKSNFLHSKKTWGTYQHVEDELRATYRNNNQLYQVIRSSEVGPGRLILKDNKIHLIKAKKEEYVSSYQVYSLAYIGNGNRRIKAAQTEELYQQILFDYYNEEIKGILKKHSPKSWQYILKKSKFLFSELTCSIPRGRVKCKVDLKIK